MSIEDIRKAFENNKDIQGVSLVNSGEFFTHADWKKILILVFEEFNKKEEFNIISLNTNGLAVTSENSDFIINNIEKYNVNFRLIFSINAFYEKTYTNLTGKNVLSIVNNNAKYFIKKSIESNNKIKNIVVGVQAVFMQENSNELRNFIAYWNDFFINLNIDFDICEDSFLSNKNYLINLRRNISSARGQNVLFNDLITELSNNFNIKISKNIEEGKDFFKKSLCKYLFKFPAISGENITICCRDTYFEYKYKNKEKEDKILEDYYKYSHLLGKFENIPLCTNCNGYEKLDKSEIKEFFLDKEIEIYKRRLIKGVYFDLYNISGKQQKIIEFLYRNDIISLTGDFENKNIYFNKKINFNKSKETDFCVLWTRCLNIKDNGVFAGCDKCNFEIKDYNEYLKKLKNNILDIIPQKCILCNEKFSFDRLRDRYYIFGNNSFYSPLLEDEENKKIINDIYNYTENKEWNFIAKLFKKNNKFLLYNMFLSNIIEKKIDVKEVYDIILNAEDFFLWSEYIIFTENYFEETIQNKLEKYSFILSDGERLRLLYKLADDKIKNINVVEIANKVLIEEKLKKSDIYKKYIVRLFENCEDSDNLIKLYISYIEFFDNLDVRGSFAYTFDNISKKYNISSDEFLKKFFNIKGISHKSNCFFDICGDFLKDKSTAPLFYSIFKFEVIKLFDSKKFFTLIKLIRKFEYIFAKYDYFLFKRLTEPDFSFYSYNYIKFLYLISYIYKKDEMYYKIFSFYIKEKNYKSAFLIFEKIENINKFWNDEQYENTRNYLLKKTDIKKYIINRIGNIFNGK